MERFTVKVAIPQSEREAQFIATGEYGPLEQRASRHLRDMQPADRALLFPVILGVGSDGTYEADTMPQTDAEWSAALAAFVEKARQQEAERLAQYRVEAERQAAQDAAREQAKADKATWVEAHGSDHLRKACAAGYDCQRLYVQERAALEYPDYVVDFADEAAWKARSCPSPAALAEAQRVGGEVVWLTAAVSEDDTWDVPCEAVVIRDFLGKYDLVRVGV